MPVASCMDYTPELDRVRCPSKDPGPGYDERGIDQAAVTGMDRIQTRHEGPQMTQISADFQQVATDGLLTGKVIAIIASAGSLSA